MTSVRSTLCALLVGGALMRPGAAHAQSASDRAAAEALFREGRKLFDAGRYPEACAKLAESERLDPAPGTLLNLAGCYEKNGQTASAWATFQQAASAARQKGRADWVDLANTRAAALEPTLSRLTITVTAASTTGLQVRRDGAVVGSAEWGTAIPLDPGSHTVDATAPGRAALHESVDVGAGPTSASVTIPDLAAEAAPVASETPQTRPDAPPPDPPRSSTLPTIGLIVAGAGVVGLGIGTAFGLAAMTKENDALHNDCTADKYCTQAGVALGQDAHSAATASTIAFGVGAAALAGGVALYFLAPRGDGAAKTVGLRATPLATSAHGGVATGAMGALVGSW